MSSIAGGYNLLYDFEHCVSSPGKMKKFLNGCTSCQLTYQDFRRGVQRRAPTTSRYSRV
jgi:hypothetical protein